MRRNKQWFAGLKWAEKVTQAGEDHLAGVSHRQSIQQGCYSDYWRGVGDYLHYHITVSKQDRIYAKPFHFGEVKNPYADLVEAEHSHRR